MPLIPIKLKPGVNQESTPYDNKGDWYYCDMTRFKSGTPQKIGGWAKYTTSTFYGICRTLFNWLTLAGLNLMALGTNLKYYIEQGGALNDITPIRASSTINNNPFATVSGNRTVTVTDTAHGAVDGDFVTYSGATAFNGLSTGNLNTEFELTYIDANSYTITVGATPNATSSGGGAAVVAAYQINVGLATEVAGVGWGAGTWGRGTWGSAASVGVAQQMRLWSQDNFGEDLVFNPLNSAIYYWDATGGVSARAVNLTSVAGASDVPTVASYVLFTEDRHLMAYGANPLGSAIQDPLFIRWASQESLVDWTPTAINTAGGYRLTSGSMILAAKKTKQENLVWTDSSVYSQQFLGPPDTFGFTFLSRHISLAGPNAIAVADEVFYWMGKDKFYLYNGRVDTLRCDLWRHVFLNINMDQLYQVYAGQNAGYNEITWFYCSLNSTVVDSSVTYNYKEDLWSYGTLSRTAWIDSALRSNPQATAYDHYMYWQEYGLDDGSTTPASGITAYLESADVDIGNGDKLQFISRIIPDVAFEGSTSGMPQVTMTLKVRDYPGAAYGTPVVSTVTNTLLGTTENYTNQMFVRLRGRQATFKIQSTGVGVTWQLGSTRVATQEDGRR